MNTKWIQYLKSNWQSKKEIYITDNIIWFIFRSKYKVDLLRWWWKDDTDPDLESENGTERFIRVRTCPRGWWPFKGNMSNCEETKTNFNAMISVPVLLKRSDTKTRRHSRGHPILCRYTGSVRWLWTVYGWPKETGKTGFVCLVDGLVQIFCLIFDAQLVDKIKQQQK